MFFDRQVYANLPPTPVGPTTGDGGGGGGSILANDSLGFDFPKAAIVGIVLFSVLLVASAIKFVRSKSFRRLFSTKRPCESADTLLENIESCPNPSTLVPAVSSVAIDVQMTPVTDWFVYVTLLDYIARAHPGCRLASFLYDCEGHGTKGDFRLDFALFHGLAFDEHGRLEAGRYRFMHSEAVPAVWEDETSSSRFSASDKGTLLVQRQSLCQVCVVEYGSEFSESLIAFATLEKINETTLDIFVHVVKDPMDDDKKNRYMRELASNEKEAVLCSEPVDFTLENELMCIEVTEPKHLKKIARVCEMPEEEKVVGRELKRICKPSCCGTPKQSKYCFTLELINPPSADHPFIVDVILRTACREKERIEKLPIRYAPTMPSEPRPQPTPPPSPPVPPDGGIPLSELGCLLDPIFMHRSYKDVAGRLGYSMSDIERVKVLAESKGNPKNIEFLLFHQQQNPAESAERFAGLLAAVNAHADVEKIKEAAKSANCQFNECLFRYHHERFQGQDHSSCFSENFSSGSPVPTTVPPLSDPANLFADFCPRHNFIEMTERPNLVGRQAPMQPSPPYLTPSQPHALPHIHKDH